MEIDTVLLKIASRCNIDCQYCYVYQSPDQGFRRQPSRMSLETVDKVIERLAEQLKCQEKPFAVVLHGGEPLLLGLPSLEHLLRGLRAALGKVATLALQTNGTLLNDGFIKLFSETRTRVAVSIDGPEAINDRFRIDRQGRSTFSATVTAIERLRDHPESSEFFRGVLAVIDPFSNPKTVYKFFKELRVPSVDFLYRDGNHERLPYGKSSFDSSEYGDWMAKLWDLYVADTDPVPVECLDNMFRGLFGGESSKEGTGDSVFEILVVETDGSITKNDTLKNSYDGADRFTEDWSIYKNSFAEVMRTAEYQRYVDGQRVSHQSCLNCPWLSGCGGGMVLHRWSDESGYDNPSVFCRDQQHLCNRMFKTLLSIC